MKNYPCIHTLLRRAGHVSWKASQIIIDAQRGSGYDKKWARAWIKMLYRQRHAAELVVS